MDIETFLSLCGLAIAAAFTPGPNNTLVATSAANFGFRATLPHIVGIAIGFPFMVFLVGFGLGEAFQGSVILREVLRWGGAVLLLWIAWRVATAASPGTQSKGVRPFTFFEAAAFQWINPKGWAFAIALTAQFIGGENPLQLAAIVAMVMVVVGFLSASSWAMFGTSMGRWLDSPGRLRWFNRAMALLLALFTLLLLAGI